MPQSADVSQTPLILDAIYTIATTQSGITFPGGKKWSMPESADEIKAAGYPYFIVLAPVTVGGDNGRGFVGGQIPRISGESRPVSDFLCYAIYPHRDPKDIRTFTTPETAKNLLEQAFTLNYTLSGTCLLSQIRDCTVIPRMEFVAGHPQPYTVVRLMLRVTERLNVYYA